MNPASAKEKIVQDYIETDQEREEGHADTRHNNFECETPDKALGCDMGIVALCLYVRITWGYSNQPHR